MISYQQYLKTGGNIKKYALPAGTLLRTYTDTHTADVLKNAGAYLDDLPFTAYNYQYIIGKDGNVYRTTTNLLDNGVSSNPNAWTKMDINKIPSRVLSGMGYTKLNDLNGGYWVKKSDNYDKDFTYSALGDRALRGRFDDEGRMLWSDRLTDVWDPKQRMWVSDLLNGEQDTATSVEEQTEKQETPVIETEVPVVKWKASIVNDGKVLPTSTRYGYRSLMDIDKDSDAYSKLTDTQKGAWQTAQDYKTAQGGWNIGGKQYYTWNGYNTAAQQYNKGIQASNAAAVEAAKGAETERLLANRAATGTSNIAGRQFNSASQSFSGGPEAVMTMNGRQLRRTLKGMNKAKAAGALNNGGTYTDWFTARKNNGVTDLQKEVTVQPEVKELDWNKKFQNGGLLSYSDYLKK